MPDGAGGAFVVWDDSRNVFVTDKDVYAQHVLGDGQIAPGWPADGLPISTEPGVQGNGRLLPDGAGGVFVLWYSVSTSYIQRLRGDGTPAPGWPPGGVLILDTAAGTIAHQAVGPDGEGGCLIVLIGNLRGLGVEYYVQRVTGDGQIAPGWPASGRRVVDASSEQVYRIWPRLVPDGLGGCYLGWSSTNEPNVIEADIYATHVLADGSVAPGWPAAGLAVAVQPRAQELTGSAPDGQGGALFAWSDQRDYDSFAAQAFVIRLRPNGTPAPGWQPQGNPMSDLPGYHYVPVLAGDGSGGGFVAYEEAFGNRGYVQRFRGDGTRPTGWPTTGLPLVDPSIATYTSQDGLAITEDGDGGAIVVWDDLREYGISNQLYAQRYTGDDITAALTSLVRVEALPDRVTLVWSRGDDAPTEVRVERRGNDPAWAELDLVRFAASGSLEYADRTVLPGQRYHYRLSWSDGRTAETAIDVPLGIALALDGLRPNPSVGEPHVVFSLPDRGETTVELLDLGGRVVRRESASHLGMGRHAVRLGSGGPLHPGVYWVRLRHEGRTLTTKGMVLR